MRVPAVGTTSTQQEQQHARKQQPVDQVENAGAVTHGDVFEAVASEARVRRSVSMPTLPAVSNTPLPLFFEDFVDALPDGWLEKFDTPLWQNLYFSRNKAVEIALGMLIEKGDWNTTKLHSQLAKAGLFPLLAYAQELADP